MRIAVVGGGAIGLFISAAYAAAGFPVTLYVRTMKQLETIKNEGIQCLDLQTGKKKKVNVCAAVLTEVLKIKADVLMICVKQPDLPAVCQSLSKKVGDDCALFFLQNGMGHIKWMDSFTENEVYACVVEQGAKKISANTVVHTGFGLLKVAPFHCDRGAARTFVKQCKKSCLPVEFVMDWRMLLEEKLIINAVINPLTAIFSIRNGDLLRNEHFLKLMQKLFDETFVVLGFPPGDKERLWRHLVHVCKNTSDNESSMFVDLKKGRRPEIEAITGYVLLKAKKKGIAVPCTAFVYESVLGLAAQKGGRKR